LSSRHLFSHCVCSHDYARTQGGVLTITLTDSDLDINRDTLETTSVLVEFLPGSGPPTVATARTLTLIETNTDSGVFTGILATAQGSGGGGTVAVYPRQDIVVTYIDNAPQTLARVVVPVVPSQVGTVETGPAATQVTYDRSAGLNIRTIDAGDSIAVTVVDADLNEDDLAPDRFVPFFPCGSVHLRLLLHFLASCKNMFSYTHLFYTFQKWLD
jgi:hypothetical protein